MKTVDRTGQRFSRWIVVKRVGSDKKHNATWLCVCDCGSRAVVAGHQLASGKSKSCGCLSADLAREGRLAITRGKGLCGKRFGRLVVDRVMSERGPSIAECTCDCGNRTSVHVSSVQTGNTRSCGCLDRDAKAQRATTHGMTKTREYASWAKMQVRCFRETDRSFKHYGGRGITVCDRWRSFENFFVDMGSCPPGKTLDRKDVNGNYEPGNCRWATDHQQARNRRNIKLSVTMAAEIRAAAQARSETQAAIAKRFGVSASLVSHIHNGRTWPVQPEDGLPMRVISEAAGV